MLFREVPPLSAFVDYYVNEFAKINALSVKEFFMKLFSLAEQDQKKKKKK